MSMKPDPKLLKRYGPVLALLVLILTLVGDRMAWSPTHTHTAGEGPHSEGSHLSPEQDHRMAIFHYNEGNKFLRQGNWKESVVQHKMALHHDKHLHPVYINLSNAYLTGEQYPEALKTLETLKSMKPEDPSLHYNLACYYSLTHQEAKSLEALQTALKLGYPKTEDVLTDPDLENLRATAEFQKWSDTL